MDNPDTVIELHRTVVEQMFTERIPPQPIDPQPFDVLSVIEGEARLFIAVSRAWFHIDANGRRWRRRDGTSTSDLRTHIGFDLRLGEHPPELGLANSTIAVTKVLGLPVASALPRTCNGRSIAFNEIPLFGRLVIHDSIERTDLTIDGIAHQDVVIDFDSQTTHDLEAEPSAPGSTSEMFGPDVQSLSNDHVVLTGVEPHVVWELTPAEQQCIRNCVVGTLLRVAGIDPIETVANKLAESVAEQLPSFGDNGTSRASLLPKPTAIDPTGQSGDPIQIDGNAPLWTRPGSSMLEESLQVQIQSVPNLPDPLPPSILALSADGDTVGLMRSGFVLLRSIRRGQIAGLCLSEDDFDPDAGCLLSHSVDIELNGDAATLVEFSATIEDEVGLDHQLLRIHGYADGSSWYAGWYVEFGIDFELTRGEVARDPMPGELPPDLQPPHTLAEINQRQAELTAENCAGGDHDAIEAEQKELEAEKDALPTEIGVKPVLFGEPFTDSDGWLTALGAAAGIAIGLVAGIGGLFVVAALSASVAVTGVSVLIAAFMIGYPLSYLGMALFDNLLIDSRVSDSLNKFVDDKSDQDGDALPLEGYSPTSVLLSDGVLKVFLAPLARRLSVRFYNPDVRRPQGDPDYVAQQVAGLMDDGRLWRLTVADAAHLIMKERITMVLDPAVSPGGQEIPVRVAHSSRGRRYLRASADAGSANNLKQLPRIPAD